MNATFEFTGEDVPVMSDDLAKDFFPTPLAVVRSSVRALRVLTPPRVILDPSAGNTGRWGLLAKERWEPRTLIGAELREVQPVTGYDDWHTGDFMYYQPPCKIDLITSNPPFSIWEYMVEHGLDMLTELGSLALFLRVQALGGRRRYLHLYPRKHLRHIHYLASRVAFIKKPDPKTGKMRPVADVWDYAMLVFDRKTHQEDPTMSWYDYKKTPMKPPPEYRPSMISDLARSNVDGAAWEHTIQMF